MAKWYLLLGLGALVGGVSAGGVILLREAHEPPARVTSERQRGSAHGADAPVIERRIVIERAPESLGEATAAASAEPAPTDPPPKTAEEAAVEVEVQFESDRPATPQARAAEATIRQTLTDPSVQGLTLQNLECRASTCRAQMTFTDEQTDAQLTRRLLLDPSSPLSGQLGMGFIVPVRDTLHDGSVAATIYFFRDAPGSGESG